MTTQYGYRRNLAAVLFFALLVVLYGGCAKSTSKSHLATRPADPDVCRPGSEVITGQGQDETLSVSDEPAGNVDEGGTYLGYRDPDYTDETLTKYEEPTSDVPDPGMPAEDDQPSYQETPATEQMNSDEYVPEHTEEVNNDCTPDAPS